MSKRINFCIETAPVTVVFSNAMIMHQFSQELKLGQGQFGIWVAKLYISALPREQEHNF